MFEEHDRVVLTGDLGEGNLKTGDVGTTSPTPANSACKTERQRRLTARAGESRPAVPLCAETRAGGGTGNQRQG